MPSPSATASLISRILSGKESGLLALPLQLHTLGVSDSSNAVLLGGGTSSDPSVSSSANARFLDFNCSTTYAGSSDSRAAYLRIHFDGEDSNAGGEALRAYSIVNENIGTAHGAHVSLAFKAEAGGSECSGSGRAIRATLQIPDVASWAPTGTYSAAQFEIYSDGTASDPAGMTALSVLELSNSGDATGAADVDTDAAILSLQGWTAAADTTKAISSVSLAELPAGTVGIRVRIGSTLYYIPAVAATAWD